jgi:YVTN family beta-propeller protein
VNRGVDSQVRRRAEGAVVSARAMRRWQITHRVARHVAVTAAAVMVIPLSIAGCDSAAAPARAGRTPVPTPYVSAWDGIIPIPLATGVPGKPIFGPGGGGQVFVAPGGTIAYVANGRLGTVTPMATTTSTPGRPVKIGPWPADTTRGMFVAITPGGQTAYVSDLAAGTVTPITTATSTVGKPIKVGQAPFDIAITPDGKTAPGNRARR